MKGLSLLVLCLSLGACGARDSQTQGLSDPLPVNYYSMNITSCEIFEQDGPVNGFLKGQDDDYVIIDSVIYDETELVVSAVVALRWCNLEIDELGSVKVNYLTCVPSGWYSCNEGEEL